MHISSDPARLAVELAALGWHILPLSPVSKRPLGNCGACRPRHGIAAHLAGACPCLAVGGWCHGVRAATTDPATITAWWHRQPRAVPGVAAGPSGLVLVDIDAHGGPPPPPPHLATGLLPGINLTAEPIPPGAWADPARFRDGRDSLALLARLRGGPRPWPTGPEHQPVIAATPSDGVHLWYRAPAPNLRQALSDPHGPYGLAWQIDLKAGWSYGIAPGAATTAGSYPVRGGDTDPRGESRRNALAEPAQRQRVREVDAHVRGVQQLEVDHLVGDASVPQCRTECRDTDVEEPLVLGASVDPDRLHRPAPQRTPEPSGLGPTPPPPDLGAQHRVTGSNDSSTVTSSRAEKQAATPSSTSRPMSSSLVKDTRERKSSHQRMMSPPYLRCGVSDLDLAVVEGGDDNGVGDGRSEFLGQVQRERGLIAAAVQEPCVRIEPAGYDRAGHVGEQHPVAEVQGGVHWIAGRPAGPGVELQPLGPADRRGEHGLERTEVPGSGIALDAEQLRQGWGEPGACLEVSTGEPDITAESRAQQDP